MTIQILVKPRSKKGPKLIKNLDGTYTAYVIEPPIDGKATASVQNLIAKHFHVSKSSVVLKSGAKSKLKIFEIL